MTKKIINRLKTKIIKVLLVTGAIGVVAGGIASAPFASGSSSVPSSQKDLADQPAQGTVAATTPTSLPSQYGPPALIDETTKTPYGAGQVYAKEIEEFAYRANDTSLTDETSEYTPANVAKRVNAVLKAVPFQADVTVQFMDTVYNLVQMYSKAYQDNGKVEAWRSKIPLIHPNDKEYAIVDFVGGPLAGASPLSFATFGWFPYARDYMFNQPQYDYFGKQIVGQYGVAAQGNFYFDRLSGNVNKPQDLQEFKDKYEHGLLGEMSLLWVIGGHLELTTWQMGLANSLAVHIVSGARLKALIKQLKAEGYERVTADGASYGYDALLQALLVYPELINELHGVSIGENTLDGQAEDKATNLAKILPPNTNDFYKRYYLSLKNVIDIRPWITAVLHGTYGQAFKDKLVVHAVKDDELFSQPDPTYKSNSDFWTALGVRFVVFPAGGGGHGYILNNPNALADTVGLTEKRYHGAADGSNA